MAFIHENGLLHLDLKPNNVLVRRTNAYGHAEIPLLTLLDFGLSQRRGTAEAAGIAGTPGYMAPEIIRGDVTPTSAADYYSLGVTLFELIEGELPFQGTLKEILHGHLHSAVRFKKQHIEFTDLFPRVKQLLNKNPKKRLEAFEDFRRNTALKAGGDLGVLERACGMGYLNSFGIVGKKPLWRRLRRWADDISNVMTRVSTVEGMYKSGVFHPTARAESTPAEEVVPKITYPFHDSDVLQEKHINTDDFKRTTAWLRELAKQLGATVSDEQEATPVRPVNQPETEHTARALLISGPSGSGKSFIVDALKAELQIHGLGGTTLSEAGAYETLVSKGTKPQSAKTLAAVDPESIVIDRFVRGWETLIEEAQRRGMVVILDGYERIGKEVKEFIAYVGRRLQLALDEGNEAGLFILITGTSPQLKKDLQQNLPFKTVDEIVIPPPGKTDLEGILARFHGHIPGLGDRDQLKDYLARDDRSSGALLARLKKALIRGDLKWEGGNWRFTWIPTRERKDEHPREDYYQTLLEGLTGKEKELVSWLGCHRGTLFVQEFQELTGIGEKQFRKAIDRVRPYRVVELSQHKDGERIGLVSEAVREAFYRAIKPYGRKLLHGRYIEYFHDKRITPGRLYELVVYHYEQRGDTRAALELRIKALNEMKRSKDIFGIRECCSNGIEFIRRVQGRKQDQRLWLLERFFIKQWIDLEWMISNYKSLIEIVSVHLVGRNRQVPLSFCYKYGTALERCGAIKPCRELITSAKKSISNKSSELYTLVLLVEAGILYSTGAYDRAVQVLGKVVKHKTALASGALAKVYMLYMLIYESRGDRVKASRYMEMCEEIAGRYGHYEQLLTASYSKILSFVNSSQYKKAKDAVRGSVRLANKHRVYRRLASMYFLASAVYYEEGSYNRALKYLDKAIRVALNIGMIELVNDFMLRYALIYQNLGFYGNAIHCAETVKNQVSEEYKSGQYFFALLILFDLHVSIHSKKAAIYKNELDQVLPHVEAKYRIALYHLLVGDYSRTQHKYDDAYEEYDIARGMYESIEYEDDTARCEIRIANTLIDEGDYEEAEKVLGQTSEKIKGMESADLEAEWNLASLALSYRRNADGAELVHYVKCCEDSLATVGDFNIRMKTNSLLFRVSVRIGEVAKAVSFFSRYYAQTKEIGRGLPDDDYVDEFVKAREFRDVVEEFNKLAKEHPSQPVS